jgi:hypothetical protein
MDFDNEEQARAYFDKKIKGEWSRMKVKKIKKVEDKRE